jgi:quercetin dioxygenase-like cupin family protein
LRNPVAKPTVRARLGWSIKEEQVPLAPDHSSDSPVIADRDEQAVFTYRGSVVRHRISGRATQGAIAVLEHECFAGYRTLSHRHLDSNLSLIVLDGRIELTAGGAVTSLGPGTSVFIPRGVVHQIAVTAAFARFTSIHCPGSIEGFVRDVGLPLEPGAAARADLEHPLPGLAEIAARYGIEINPEADAAPETTNGS